MILTQYLMFNAKKRNRNTRKRNKLDYLNQATTTKRKTRVCLKKTLSKQTNKLNKRSKTEQSKMNEQN